MYISIIVCIALFVLLLVYLVFAKMKVHFYEDIIDIIDELITEKNEDIIDIIDELIIEKNEDIINIIDELITEKNEDIIHIIDELITEKNKEKNIINEEKNENN